MSEERKRAGGFPCGLVLAGCVGLGALGLALLGGLAWRLESSLPPREAHPSLDALLSEDAAATRAELEWAARTALAHAAGAKLPGAERQAPNYVRLAQGRGCVYDVFDEAARPLQALAKQGKTQLADVELRARDGSPYAPPQGGGPRYGSEWRLLATVGGERLVFEFEWHSVTLGSSLNLISVRPAGEAAKTRRATKTTKTAQAGG